MGVIPNDERKGNMGPYGHATPQAWRRIWAAVGPGEARDLAADIAQMSGADAEIVEWMLSQGEVDQ